MIGSIRIGFRVNLTSTTHHPSLYAQFIFCNPSNPTGSVHAPALVDAIGEVLKRPNAQKVWVLADEIYERIIYDTPHK